MRGSRDCRARGFSRGDRNHTLVSTRVIECKVGNLKGGQKTERQFCKYILREKGGMKNTAFYLCGLCYKQKKKTLRKQEEF